MCSSANLEVLDANRFDLKFGLPGLSRQQLNTAIELYGAQVIPRVRELVAAEQAGLATRTQPTAA